MTTDVQRPYDIYVGNGTLTLYAYTFSRVEDADILVLVGGAIQTLFTDYIIQNQQDVGGEIVFTTAPAALAVILILRKTTMSQQLDYITPDGFPTESHENELDKITYILQELLGAGLGGIGADGEPIYLTFDLSIVQGVVSVTIVNSGGTDAVIPDWVSGTLAGVFHGEITDSAPAADSATAEADGHVWLEHA